jgi:hypothetical protein
MAGRGELDFAYRATSWDDVAASAQGIGAEHELRACVGVRALGDLDRHLLDAELTQPLQLPDQQGTARHVECADTSRRRQRENQRSHDGFSARCRAVEKAAGVL